MFPGSSAVLPACLPIWSPPWSFSFCLQASIKRSAQASSTYVGVHTYTQLLADSRKKLDCYNYDFHVCTLTATMLSNGPCILCVVQQSSRENKTERERERERKRENSLNIWSCKLEIAFLQISVSKRARQGFRSKNKVCSIPPVYVRNLKSL